MAAAFASTTSQSRQPCKNSLMARLDRMSLAKPVAQLAAVLGRGFTFQLLSAVAPKNWRPIDAALEALTSAEIILPVPGAQSSFQFKHALLQDVAYNSSAEDDQTGLPRADRSRHRRAIP